MRRVIALMVCMIAIAAISTTRLPGSGQKENISAADRSAPVIVAYETKNVERGSNFDAGVPDFGAQECAPSHSSVDNADGLTAAAESSLQQAIESSHALSSDDSLEARLTAYRLRRDEWSAAEKFEHLAHTQALYPTSMLAAYEMIRLCGRPNPAPQCARTDSAAALLALDNDNSWAWLSVATLKSSNGNLDEALDALESANIAPQLREPIGPWMDTAERGLRSIGELTNTSRYLASMQLAVNPTYSTVNILFHCLKQAQEDLRWRTACMQAGRRLEQDATSLLNVQLGRSIQISMHQLDGNTTLADQIKRRSKAAEDTFLQYASRLENDISLERDDYLRRFIAVYQSDGHLAAMDDLLQRLNDADERMEKTPCLTPDATTN